MPADRRDFLGTLLAAGVLGKLDAPRAAGGPEPETLPWADRIRGSHRAVFDNPRDDGSGIIRAWIWLNQCHSILGAPPDDCTAVVVLRHGGAALAMSDPFWDRYEMPMSGSTPEKPNVPKRNPQMASVMTDSMATFPPPARMYAEGIGLDSLIARGGIVLVCEFAFYGVITRIKQRDQMDEADARARAVSLMVPGVTLVPSGFFALALTQEKGCGYITNV